LVTAQRDESRRTMTKIERTITIHRPVEEVFAYICVVEHGPRYTSGQREAHQTSSGPVAV
jgi:uncharacterized membrane protein